MSLIKKYDRLLLNERPLHYKSCDKRHNFRPRRHSVTADRAQTRHWRPVQPEKHLRLFSLWLLYFWPVDSRFLSPVGQGSAQGL
uniref:Uncharacterized protein n=1 Tax=Macrostomum lignano TaxID=282301 RepID=A0A1I8FR97_9PLAT